MNSELATSEPRTITLSWVTKSGGHTIERIKASELESRIVKLCKRGLKAVAWVGDNRSAECGWSWKLDGRWRWCVETNPLSA